MEYLLLILAVALGVSKNIFTKIVKKESASFYDTLKLNVVTFTCAFIAVFLIGIKSVETIFQVPWLLAVCYAVCTLGSQISLMKAVELGSVSISSLFYSCGFMLPTLFGSIYYKEEINVLHIIGLVLIIISFILSVKKETEKTFNIGWLIAALGGLFFSGMVGIMQKLFSNEYSQYKMDNFLCVAFVFIILICVCSIFFAKLAKYNSNQGQLEPKVEKEIKKRATPIKQYGFTVALGTVMGLVNKTNTFLSGVLSSVIVFPVINGGVILATTVTSMFVFKEKLSIMQKLGLVIGILGIISIAIGKAVI